MHLTFYPQVNSKLNELQLRIRKIFGHKLIGPYLYGSYVTKDFDYNLSDIDGGKLISDRHNF